jgi:hypothetical protein
VQRSLKVVLDASAVQSRYADVTAIKGLLKPVAQGVKGGTTVTLSVEVTGVPKVLGGRIVDIPLPGRYDLGTHERGQLMTMPGVVELMDA